MSLLLGTHTVLRWLVDDPTLAPDAPEVKLATRDPLISTYDVDTLHI